MLGLRRANLLYTAVTKGKKLIVLVGTNCPLPIPARRDNKTRS